MTAQRKAGDDMESWLSLDAIRNYETRFGTREGKFVRRGSHIVIGPYNDVEPRFKSHHRILYLWAVDQKLDGLAQPITEEALPRTSDMADMERNNQPVILHDAGHFRYLPWSNLDAVDGADYLDDYPEFAPDGAEGVVDVFGSSDTFSQATEAGRSRTGELFKMILGDTVIVEARLL